MSSPSATVAGESLTPLHHDLVAMLRAARAAERDLFSRLGPDVLEAPMSGDTWSAKDVQAHLAAWRAIEARRLQLAASGHDSPPDVGDPPPGEPIDDVNQRLHAERADWTWEAVASDADSSVEALIDAIRASSVDALCECGDLVAGIGANGINHAIGHLGDIARLAGDRERFDAFSRDVEAVLRHSHLPPRDSGVMLYNVACHSALSGRLNDARRLLRTAIAHRGDLLEHAARDPDLTAIRADLQELARPI